MPIYKYEDWYESHKYASFSLHEEFTIAAKHLLQTAPNREVFAAVDEIYHWFCVKQEEVEELLKRIGELEAMTSKRCELCGADDTYANRVNNIKSGNITIGRFGGSFDVGMTMCECCAEKARALMVDSFREFVA